MSSTEILYTFPDIDNITDFHVPLAGWVSSSRDRGSIDILWSCCITILLCCWVATHPNACAPEDKWYHAVIDKFYLALVGCIGPDFLLAVAVGQYSSARRSVKRFQQDPALSKHGKWTLQYGFFVDMGGIYLAGPDYPDAFPINAEQLFYLVKHGHVEFPNMSELRISERDNTDVLARTITAWQVTWFAVIEFQRIAKGLPMTTLELTTLSFVPVLLATTLLWYHKPSITTPSIIRTKGDKTIERIRQDAKDATHPDLSDNWHRTPLDFLGEYHWAMNADWFYATQMLRARFLTRPSKDRLWRRYPSDLWLAPDRIVSPFTFVIGFCFSISMLFAWKFYFPTKAEQTAWRVCSAYQALWQWCGGCHYYAKVIQWHRARRRPPLLGTPRVARDTEAQAARGRPGRLLQVLGKTGLLQWLSRTLDRARNISPDGDPYLAVSLRSSLPVILTCVPYILCRLFFYTEDFVSLRMQPVGVYVTVNRSMPFVG